MLVDLEEDEEELKYIQDGTFVILRKVYIPELIELQCVIIEKKTLLPFSSYRERPTIFCQDKLLHF